MSPFQGSSDADQSLSAADLIPKRLRCEHLENPLGVDCAQPRLSWTLQATASKRGVWQTGYRILVASSRAILDQGQGDLWDSGEVTSAQSHLVEYKGSRLPSLQYCHWKVQIWDEQGRPSAWSEAAQWRMGLLERGDWNAEWIWCSDSGKTAGACPWFRQTFTLDQVPEEAVACVSSIGYHELYVNGRKVGDEVLAPSVSDLRQRALYVTHDISSYLQHGRNVVAIWVGPGWSMFSDANPVFDFQLEKKPLCIARFDFGTAHSAIVTDASWRCMGSNTFHLGKWQNDDFGGDRIDGRLSCADWNQASFDDSSWQQAEVVPDRGWKLSPDLLEPNRLCEKISAVELTTVSPGKYRFVMAQNFTGWVEVKIAGSPGTLISINVSPVAHRELECNQHNEFIIGPTGEGVFRNRFSYHEFGFVTIEGLEKPPHLTDVVGYLVVNDRERTGGFDCSNPLLKQIYDITARTYENLCTGGMTVDCPHRERLGYGGDGHTSMEIAVDSFESASFLSKWAQDWCDIQDENGRINHTAPTMGGGGGPAWSGLIVTLPWEVYLSYGDQRLLEKTFPFAMKWLAHLDRSVGDAGLLAPLLPGDWKYMDEGMWLFLGDWVAPGRHEWSKTPEALLFNNCYYLYVLGITARVAKITGQPEVERALSAKAESLQKAINDRFLDPATKAYLDLKQSHSVMPLVSGAVLEKDITTVENNLENEILVACQGHLDTGLHGTYFMTKYLTEHDRSDLIFTYASQTTYPSYGDLIAKGYDTWPELWEGSDSLIHGCLNGIGGWFQRGLAGIQIDPSSPGYQKVVIKPAMVGDITWVKAHHDSPYGRIASNWKRDGDSFTMEINIPPNSTATVHVPGTDRAAILESNKPVAQAKGVKFLGERSGKQAFEVASGTYVFSGPTPTAPR